MFVQVLVNSNGRCDKCGEIVPDENNAAWFDSILKNDPTAYIMGASRHLLPVVREGVQICEGSPSRAQYLEGQPRDPRRKYNPEREAPHRAAYEQMKRGALAHKATLN